MSTSTRIADRLPQLLADQRRDSDAFDGTLRLSNRALAAGDLVAAERLGRSAEDIMARIRLRSKTMANLLDSVEYSLAGDATTMHR